MTARFAIYFAPADDSPLGVYGATVLRRRASSAEEWINPSANLAFEHTPTWKACIKKPAHYGFHATIKAPFELAANRTAEELASQLEQFCARQTPIPLAGLAPRRTCRYDALALSEQPDALKQLASECVVAFEPFRASLSEADIARRHAVELSERQQHYLNEYGYPFVLEDFNFHMTLSGSKPDNSAYLQWLSRLFASTVTTTQPFDRLCLFKQENRETSFTRITEHCFPGSLRGNDSATASTP